VIFTLLALTTKNETNLTGPGTRPEQKKKQIFSYQSNIEHIYLLSYAIEREREKERDINKKVNLKAHS
jgi:hypothetical protein